KALWREKRLGYRYGALPPTPTQSMAACFVAAMREWKRSFESQARSFGGLPMRIEKVLNVSIARRVARAGRKGHECLGRARSRAAGAAASGAGNRRIGGSLCRPVRHRLGHHVELSV